MYVYGDENTFCTISVITPIILTGFGGGELYLADATRCLAVPRWFMIHRNFWNIMLVGTSSKSKMGDIRIGYSYD